MKQIFLYCIVFYLTITLSSCSKEGSIVATDELGFEHRFSPKDDELPAVKQMFEKYNLWLRFNFTDPKEVTNSILFDDVNNRFGATQIDPDMTPSALMFVDTLLHNSSVKFVREIFPPEFFFVKTYNGSFWKQDIGVLGRTRLVVCWPNERAGTQPITVPETHYYQDSVLTRMVWSSLSGMLAQRMPLEIPGFVAAGMPYDNGKALDEITTRYQSTNDTETYQEELSTLAAERGYIAASGSRSYTTDLAQWISLLVTESYENIKENYLDNSVSRTEKYKIFTEYLKKEYNWDIQSSGNNYRKQLDSFQ